MREVLIFATEIQKDILSTIKTSNIMRLKFFFKTGRKGETVTVEAEVKEVYTIIHFMLWHDLEKKSKYIMRAKTLANEKTNRITYLYKIEDVE